MAQMDYYAVLGVSRNDTEEEIRKAFRRKAMEYHPDRNKNPDAEEKFKEVNEAYQVLIDAKKRAQYDRFGHAGVNSSNGFDQPFDGFDVFGGFGDIFDSFFGDGGGRRARAPQRGGDLEERVTLSFEEAAFGAEREVRISRVETCHHCSGGGNEPGTPMSVCGTCQGNGQVRRTQRSVFGQFAQVAACPTCQGKGKTIEQPCSVCRSAGVEQRKREMMVNIPAGVQDGMHVRLPGEGNVGRNGGPAGNLYVQIAVKKHAFFEREDYDLLYALPLNIAEATLGVEKEIPTLEGAPASLKIPPGTQPGAKFRIRGRGVSHINSPSGNRGDLRVFVDLKVPQKLNSRQRKLLEELARSLDPQSNVEGTATSVHDLAAEDAEIETNDSCGKEKGIFDRIKDVLG